MKPLAKISMGILLLSLTVFSIKQSNERSTLNNNLQNLLHINQAQAETGEGKCEDFGYEKWGKEYVSDGYDCDCNEREGVHDRC